MTTNISIILAMFVALAGSGGVIFGALRFNRDEAQKIVNQQAQLLDDLEALYLITKAERDELRVEVSNLRSEIASLRDEAGKLRRAVKELGA